MKTKQAKYWSRPAAEESDFFLFFVYLMQKKKVINLMTNYMLTVQNPYNNWKNITQEEMNSTLIGKKELKI